MIARVSLEKSLPRFASTAPFLWRIECHLLCPDTGLLPHQIEEALVNPQVVRQLWVEGGDEVAPVPKEHRLAVELREHVHLRADAGDPGSADEDPPKRRAAVAEFQIGLEARHLAAICVPLDLHVNEPELLPPEQDHARAGSEDGPLEPPNP